MCGRNIPHDRNSQDIVVFWLCSINLSRRARIEVCSQRFQEDAMREDIVVPAKGRFPHSLAHVALPMRERLRVSLRGSLPVLAIIAVLLLLWEGSKLLFNISDSTLPHVYDVIAVFATRTQGGTGPLLLTQMFRNAWATFGVAFGGFVFGGMFGFALAWLFTQFRLLERSFMPYVIGSQTVPILAIAPMVVVGLGSLGAPDWVAKAVVAAYLTFFPVTIGMLRGLRAASLMRST